MEYSKERVSNNVDVRKETNHQPKSVQNDEPGHGSKKLEGPNRPST
ncbi:hypothetical protein [Brevibacillus massiliensis]|jgi:hypothetical protein|nr:hypothetical protein [Brevibacillus massiliensis]